jgi:hypothetical protein
MTTLKKSSSVYGFGDLHGVSTTDTVVPSKKRNSLVFGFSDSPGVNRKGIFNKGSQKKIEQNWFNVDFDMKFKDKPIQNNFFDEFNKIKFWGINSETINSIKSINKNNGKYTIKLELKNDPKAIYEGTWYNNGLKGLNKKFTLGTLDDKTRKPIDKLKGELAGLLKRIENNKNDDVYLLIADDGTICDMDTEINKDNNIDCNSQIKNNGPLNINDPELNKYTKMTGTVSDTYGGKTYKKKRTSKKKQTRRLK